MPVTTHSAQAQTCFNQGMALLYGYWCFEARRSFEAAMELGSTCAMCHWGLFQALSERFCKGAEMLNVTVFPGSFLPVANSAVSSRTGCHQASCQCGKGGT